MSDPIYIFAGGGTGGHLYPGLAVAGELCLLKPRARVVFACSDRPIDRHILDPTPYGVVPQAVRPIPRGARGWLAFARAYLHSAAQARRMIADLRPAAVLGLGGFAAGPLVCRAAKAGIRTGLLNPDAVPGRANRMLARRADAVFTQFEQTAACFPQRLRARVHPVGCPVRREFASPRRDEALRHFDLRPDRKTFLVNGGSLGAASINEAVAQLTPDLDELADTWQIIHVTGKAKDAPAARAGRPHARVIEYCRRMDLAYAAADLALSRGGASTVAELMATGTPAVLMPYPYHADQQQRHNARPLVEAGAALLCDDARDGAANAASLRKLLLPILRDDARLAAMRQAAATLTKSNAAGEVARWLVGSP